MVPGELLWPQAMEELFERDYNTIADEIEAYRIGNNERVSNFLNATRSAFELAYTI